MATGNIDTTLAGQIVRSEAAVDQFGNSVWNKENIPGQSDHPTQDCRRGTLVGAYSFDIHGGAVGEYELEEAETDMVILNSWIVAGTAMAGAGAGTDIGLDGGDEISAAAEGLTLNEKLTGDAGDGTIENSVAVSKGQKITLTIGTSAATAGSFVVLLDVLKVNG